MATELTDMELGSANEVHWIRSVLNDYKISWTHGFAPEKEPLLQFSDPYFNCWDEIFNNLTNLIHNGGLRQAVQNRDNRRYQGRKAISGTISFLFPAVLIGINAQMPLLDHNKLKCYEEWQRADMVLSVIGNGYVWQNGENDPATVIPKCLAIPWFSVAEYIGDCPVISQCCGVLTNWKIIDPTRPVSVSNIDTQFSFTGDEGEHWFFMISLQVELDAAPGIRSVVAAQKAVVNKDKCLLKKSLITLTKCIVKLKSTLKRMYEKCDPEFFYAKLRVFLSGWKNNKFIPNGLLYEGVNSQPLQYSGGSAAESSVFQTFNAVLGVANPTSEDGKPSFLESMLDYMPRCHREFIYSIRKGPSVRDYVKRTTNGHLKEVFNDCVESLVEFRSFHMQIVTSYIIIQAARKKHVDKKMLEEAGTGGTGIMPFLKSVRHETSKAKIM